MITPVRTLKVGALCERKNDLLVSVDDIKMIASKEREKTIDKFITAYKNHCEEKYGDVAEQEICDMEIVAEQLKGGAT